MPTLKQLREQIDFKIKKFGPDAHCGQLIVSEEVRKEAIENKPDANGRRRTRITLETYSPEAYINWNAALERLIERCGFNPILLVDLLLLLVQIAEMNVENQMDGITRALHGLHAVADYEQKLRDAKAEKRRLKKAAKANSEFLAMTENAL